MEYDNVISMPASFTKLLDVPVEPGLILPEPSWCRRRSILSKTSWPNKKQLKNLPALKMRTNVHAASPSRQSRSPKRLHLKVSFLGRKQPSTNSYLVNLNL